MQVWMACRNLWTNAACFAAGVCATPKFLETSALENAAASKIYAAFSLPVSKKSGLVLYFSV
jgi:hypothetical protein